MNMDILGPKKRLVGGWEVLLTFLSYDPLKLHNDVDYFLSSSTLNIIISLSMYFSSHLYNDIYTL